LHSGDDIAQATSKGVLARWLSGPVLLLPLAVLLGGAIYSLSHLSNATAWLEHSDEVRVAIERLRSTILAGETGLRGYLVAGEPTFMGPYRAAIARWATDFEHVRALTTDDMVQQQRLRRLDELLHERFRVLGDTFTAFEAGARGAKLTTFMRRGQTLMDEIRSTIDEMEREETHLDIVRQGMAIRRWQLTMVLFVGGAFASLLLLSSLQLQRRGAEARRQQAESVTRAIDGERHLLQAILGGIEDGITLQDRSGRLIFANASAARSIGFESPEALLAAAPEELVSRFRMFDEAGAPLALDRLPARIVLGGHAHEASLIVRYRRGDDGDDRWSRVRAYPVYDAAGRLVQAINVFQDVTDDHRADERRSFFARAIQEMSSSLDYQATLSAVARLTVPTLADWCAIDIVEGERTRRLAIAHVDPEKLSLVAEIERRYPPDPNAPTGVPEIVRTGEPQLIPAIPRQMLLDAARDPDHLALIDRLALTSYLGIPLKSAGRVIGVISLAMAESGRRYGPEDLEFVQTLADRAALAIENARLFLEVARSREVLATRLADETKRRYEAENTSRFAETFVGILGHDLRNPLNAISMTARLLERKEVHDPRAIRRILSSTERMSNMVAQLLDLTRSRLAGGITIERRAIHLGQMILEVMDELRRTHPEREIRFEQRGDDSALGDQDRLAQVVSNLVGNAVEHGDAASPVVVTLEASGDSSVLIVHNAGRPIPHDLQPIIFDPFRRTTARGDLARGLGLGLFISQQIVLAHGGTIELTSSLAEGTTFTVRLPRPLMQGAPSAAAAGNLEA
jgi:signal transduction histidine kinase/CHASE3 domain sensor protein